MRSTATGARWSRCIPTTPRSTVSACGDARDAPSCSAWDVASSLSRACACSSTARCARRDRRFPAGGLERGIRGPTPRIEFDRPSLRAKESFPMQELDKIWMNGELVDWADAKIHVGTHGLHYGSGVFRGIRAYQSSKGSAVSRLTDPFP